MAGIHPSTYYSWLRKLTTDGIDGLTPRSGRTRILSPERIRLESEVVALSLANPPWGPKRLFLELHQRGVTPGSPSQVWRILKAHGLNQRRYRYRLIAVARGFTDAEASPQRRRWARQWIGTLDADEPGDLVQFDCFHLGQLKEARLGTPKRPGHVWQYTAIDVASSFVWAELHTTRRNPSAVHTSALAHRVAADLARWGWTFKTASTDRGNEFVAHRFHHTLTDHGVTHRFIAPGRPQSNGKVEQVQSTILEECWKPAFVTYHEPSITGLRHDLAAFIDYYNTQRPHGGKWNKGHPPTTIITPNTRNQP
jgi:transposase InsO family protein